MQIDENVAREIINHRSLRHPNIIRFKEVWTFQYFFQYQLIIANLVCSTICVKYRGDLKLNERTYLRWFMSLPLIDIWGFKFYMLMIYLSLLILYQSAFLLLLNWYFYLCTLLLKVVLTPTHLAIVMEYAAGGELFDRICTAGRFSEDEVTNFS